MKIHVPSMLAVGVEMTNKQTQQTNKQPQWLIKFIKYKSYAVNVVSNIITHVDV